MHFLDRDPESRIFARSREQEAFEDALDPSSSTSSSFPRTVGYVFPGLGLRSLKRSDDSRNYNRFAFRLGTQLESERIVCAIAIHLSILSRERSISVKVKRLSIRIVDVLLGATKIREIVIKWWRLKLIRRKVKHANVVDPIDRL